MWQEISNFISAVGFPIAGCAALFWYMVQQRNAHKAEMEKMAEALNNNTLAMQQNTLITQQFIAKFEKEEENESM